MVADWAASKTASPVALWAIVGAVGVLTLGFALLLVLNLCRVPMSPRGEAMAMGCFLLAFLLARPMVVSYALRWCGQEAWATRLGELTEAWPVHPVAGNMALIVWAIFLGRLASHVVREGKLLLPVAVVASIADGITVFRGVVAKMSEHAPEVVAALSVNLPVAPPAGVSVPVLTAVGIGDFLFLALFLAVALRYQMNAVAATWGAFAAMLVAPFAFFIWPEAPGMPGLPFISAGVLAANWRHFHYSAAERRALAIGGVVVGAAAVAVWVMGRR